MHVDNLNKVIKTVSLLLFQYYASMDYVYVCSFLTNSWTIQLNTQPKQQQIDNTKQCTPTQQYSDTCPAGEEHMQCEVDPNMRITATTHAEWYGAPPGLFCAPKIDYPWVGFWDYSHWCKNPWADPPESCDVYEVSKEKILAEWNAIHHSEVLSWFKYMRHC